LERESTAICSKRAATPSQGIHRSINRKVIKQYRLHFMDKPIINVFFRN
jgi:hypothetical protein